MPDNRADHFVSYAIAVRRRVGQINSRARRQGAPGQITAADLVEKLDTQKRCATCGKVFGTRFHDRWMVSFVVPFLLGGECCRANISVICRQCEMERSAKMGAWGGPMRRVRAKTPSSAPLRLAKADSPSSLPI